MLKLDDLEALEQYVDMSEVKLLDKFIKPTPDQEEDHDTEI